MNFGRHFLDNCDAASLELRLLYDEEQNVHKELVCKKRTKGLLK
jgi:hypothetical protein